MATMMPMQQGLRQRMGQQQQWSGVPEPHQFVREAMLRAQQQDGGSDGAEVLDLPEFE